MCEVTKYFKLCSCSTDEKVDITHNKNSRRFKNFIQENNPSKIIWTLYKYEGQQYSGMDGLLIAPAEKIDEIFTAEYVKTELNKRHCFDFEYTPNEGDYLVLTIHYTKQEAKRNEYKFLPFIYSNGQWTINSYNSFYEKIVELKNGIVKME